VTADKWLQTVSFCREVRKRKALFIKRVDVVVKEEEEVGIDSVS
jgi:hypothetical protein